MARHICSLLEIFCAETDRERFGTSCLEKVVKPAVQLQEKFLTLTHHFYVSIQSHTISNSCFELGHFLDDIGDLSCENILDDRRHIKVSKEDLLSGNRRLPEKLVNVLTIAPALYLRQVERGNAVKSPIVLRKQHTLVAYGSREKLAEFMANGTQTLMDRICSLQQEEPRPLGQGHQDLVKGQDAIADRGMLSSWVPVLASLSGEGQDELSWLHSNASGGPDFA